MRQASLLPSQLSNREKNTLTSVECIRARYHEKISRFGYKGLLIRAEAAWEQGPWADQLHAAGRT